MTIAILSEDLPTGEILAALLKRADVEAVALRAPRPRPNLDDHLAAMRPKFSEIVWVDGPARKTGARPISIRPSLAAWLTRDSAANLEVLGTAEVPDPAAADAWLRARRLPGDRRYNQTRDGRGLAAHLDLGVLAGFSIEFRELLARVRPGWATTQPIKRGRGRPPGVALFRGTGYALCLELLHRGERAAVTPAELIEVLRRTKTPILRLIGECQRRGYLQRTATRGPLLVRNTTRLLDDLVADARARLIQHPPALLRLSTDRDPADLATRLSRVLGEHGRLLAVTGAPAVAELGGDRLIDGVVRAYANLKGIESMLGEAHLDPRNPHLILIEPLEEAVLHRLRPGTPSLVSSWQAVIDLLTSESEREREVGTVVRRRLEGSR